MDKATQGIREQAAEWVVHLHDAVSPADTQAFVAWLRSSPVHIREYLRSEAAWFALEGIDPAKRLDVDAMLDESAAGVLPLNVVPLATPAGEAQAAQTGAAAALARSRFQGWRVAAAVLVAVALPLAYFAGAFHADPVYSTAVGEQRTVVLEDGSVMELNTASAVTVRYSRGDRDIDMASGEAFFTVKKDASRPFRVFSNGVEVKAVGTQFNVYRHDASTVVTVLEGKVEVQPVAAGTPQVAPLQLVVGAQAVVTGNRQVVTHDDAAMARALAWRERKLVFAEEPLANVVEEVNRYNLRQLVVADPVLASRRISGVFNVHDPEVIVRFLARSPDVAVTENATGAWVLSPGTTNAP